MPRYRPNAAALMINPSGKLLVCERKSIPGAWQFPQGGADPGESLKQALYREVYEEIGLSKDHYKVTLRKNGYRYLYPEKIRKKKILKHGHHGQEQTYFLCHLNPDAPEPDVNQKPAEFRDYKWIDPGDFDIRWVPDFKQNVYRAVMKDFFGVEC